MSLRIKILLVLVVVPMICLSLFLFFLIQSFKDDKRAYLYEVQRLALSSLATVIGTDLAGSGARSDSFTVHFPMANVLPPAPPQISGAWPRELSLDSLRTEMMNVCAKDRGFGWWTPVKGKSYFLMCAADKMGVVGLPGAVVLSLFQPAEMSRVRLLTRDGFVLASNAPAEIGTSSKEIYSASVLDDIYKQGRSQGQGVETSGRDRKLLTYTQVDRYPLYLVYENSESMITRAASPFIVRGGFALLAILCAVGLISQIFSRTLTRNLNHLIGTITTFAGGDINVRATEVTKDEIGEIATAFNSMADQMNVLMREAEQKARTEHEMKLAADLQRGFLPKENLLSQDVDATIFYQAAEFCGGDWCYFFERSGRVILCIADATGHGFNSALLTAAARTVESQMERRFISPKIFMAELNSAIWAITGGELQMTCVVVEYNPSAKTITVCNASHELPVIYPLRADVRREEFMYLASSPGVRLGEDVMSEYEEKTFSIRDPMGLLLYSDGLVELRTHDGKMFGERRMLKALQKSAAVQARALGSGLNVLMQDVAKFQDGAPLADDVSLVIANLR